MKMHAEYGHSTYELEKAYGPTQCSHFFIGPNKPTPQNNLSIKTNNKCNVNEHNYVIYKHINMNMCTQIKNCHAKLTS